MAERCLACDSDQKGGKKRPINQVLLYVSHELRISSLVHTFKTSSKGLQNVPWASEAKALCSFMKDSPRKRQL